jgi:hypothetical protein
MVCIGFLSPFSRSRHINSLPADYLSVYIKKDLAAINKVFLFCEAFMKLYLIKAFPAPNLRCEAAFSTANSCASAGGSKEILI